MPDAAAAALLRSLDWSQTPLGPIEGWPRRLMGYVEMILELPTPAIIFWGPELTQIYNDGYAVIMGPRHPRYFGASYRDCWPDTAPTILPWMRQVTDEGRHIEVARAPFTLTRHGFPEETYFTFTFSPLRDDEGRIVGIYQPVIEMTDAVLRERRAETLRLLTAPAEDVLPLAARVFEANELDVPFAEVHLWSEAEGALRVASASGLGEGRREAGDLLSLGGVVARVFETNRPEPVEVEVPIEVWPEPVRTAFVVPLRRSAADPPLGVAVLGVSPRLVFDARYREFLETVAREMGTSLAAQRAGQAEKAWRERAQAAKEALARRLAMLFEHAPVGIAVLQGPEHVYEVANPHHASLLRNRPLLRLPLRQALPELAGQGLFELVEQVYRSGEPFIGRSVRLVVTGDDGAPQERFFDFVYQPMPGDDGKTESIIVVVFEVTELALARGEAEAASRTKDEFFAILGHELRNPLAPIVTALQLMRLRGGDVFVKERDVIERQVAQITRLVDDLLDVSRITRGKIALKRELVELSDVVARGIEMASPLLEQRRHRLDVQVATRGLVIDGDAARLAQVVSNLLTNAAKYTEAGGEVRVRADRVGDRVTLAVADTGIGIDAGMLPRVFEPFAQEGQALDRAQGGLGLGLTIVANVTKLHGGSVAVQSAGRGKGATFTVSLPLATGAAATPAQPTAAPLGRAHGAVRVLVVDDNEDAAEMLAEGLAALGYDTRVAHDGAEAVRVADEFSPDVGLLDLGLPVMDGYELARQLRRTFAGRRLHLVAITGYGQESDRQRVKAAGFDAHLVKPVDIGAVAEAMGRLGARPGHT